MRPRTLSGVSRRVLMPFRAFGDSNTMNNREIRALVPHAGLNALPGIRGFQLYRPCAACHSVYNRS